MARNVHLVIASFRENLDWLRENAPCSFTLCNSSPDGAKWWEETSYGGNSNFGYVVTGDLPSKPVENVSKEAGQYLSYIINHYDNLPERIVFCQADLGARVFTAHRTMKDWSNVLKKTIRQISQIDRPVGVLGSFLEPLPERIVPFPELEHRVFKEIIDPDKAPTFTVAGHVGAQFWVDRSLIRKFPVSYFQQIYDLKGMLAWDLEYVWPAVFQPDVSPEIPTPQQKEKEPANNDSEAARSTSPL